MSNPMRAAFRITSIAVAILVIGTAMAEAKDKNEGARDDCKSKAGTTYNGDKASCDLLPSDALYNTCVRNASDRYTDALVKCDNDYPPTTKPAADFGFGGPNADELEGWHPKGSKTKGLTSGQTPGLFGGDGDDSKSGGNGLTSKKMHRLSFMG